MLGVMATCCLVAALSTAQLADLRDSRSVLRSTARLYIPRQGQAAGMVWCVRLVGSTSGSGMAMAESNDFT